MEVLGLFSVTGLILLARNYWGMRSSLAALHTASAIIIILYLAALAGFLRAGATILLVGGAAAFLFEGARIAREKRALPLPVGVFLIVALVFWLLHRHGGFAYYDEFAHWGIFTKEMLVRHAFWGADTNAMHVRYLPGAPLWQYLFLLPGGMHEGGAYLAQFCLLLLPLLVLWEKCRWGDVAWILFVLALIALALSNFGHGFASLYVDHVIAAWFAGTLFNFLLDTEQPPTRRIFSYAAPLCALVLIKDSALYFALVAVGLMAIMLAVAHWQSEKRRILRTAAILIVTCVAAQATVVASWNAQRNAIGVQAATVSTGGIVSGIISGRSNLTEDEQDELQRRFIEVAVSHQISKDEISARYNAFTYSTLGEFQDRFRLTTAGALILFALWLALIAAGVVRTRNRLVWMTTGCGMLAAAVVYLLVLLLSYRFAFDDRALTLSSWVRYVHTILLPMLLFIFLPLLPVFRLPDGRLVANRIRVSTASASVLLVALYVFETPYLQPLYRAHESPPIAKQVAPLAGPVRDVVGDDRLWVFFPIPDSFGLVGRILRYQLTPTRVEVVVDPQYFVDNPNAMTAVVNESDFLWFPLQSAETDAMLTYFFGENLGQRMFRVDRTGEHPEVIPLDNIF